MELIKFLQSFSSDFLNLFMILITHFGSIYVLMFLICIIYWCYNKEVGYKIAIVLSCSYVLNSLVKGLVQASRPIGSDGIFSIGEFTASGYSFPSGHTQNITTFGVNLFIFNRNKLMFLLSCTFIVLVSVSRIYLGLHWPIDILGGVVLALIVSILLNEILVKLDNFKINILIGVLILIFMVGFTFISWDKMGQDYFNSLGLFIGIYLGHLFENRYVNFSPSASNIDNVMKLIIGIFTTVLIDVLFTYLFGDIVLSFILKYFIIGFWIIGCIPLIFKISNLYYKEAYEITNVKYRK